jgi:hypothetical protein
VNSKIAGAAALAAFAALLAGAPTARADDVDAGPGEVRSSLQADKVENSTWAWPWNVNGDPSATYTAQGTVRAADMADAHRPSFKAEPVEHELAAIEQSWGRSICHWGMSGITERCRDAGR